MAPPAAGENGKTLASYSREEVAKHKSPDSFWAIYDNDVFDVTKFMKIHPGGSAIILNAVNKYKDMRQVMHSSPHKHSNSAFSILLKYRNHVYCYY